MSKGSRKSRHRAAPVPWYVPAPAVLDERYQRQVDRSTEKLERQYAQAAKRLRQAEARLARVQATSPAPKRHELARLEAVIQIRRDELEELRRMMVSVPASSTHRGTESFRPVPIARHDSP